MPNNSDRKGAGAVPNDPDRQDSGGLRFFPLDLRDGLNLKGIASAEDPREGRLDEAFGLAKEAFPPPGRALLLGVAFDLPARGEGEEDCMIPEGRRIETSPGAYDVLFVLGTSVMGSAGCEVTFEFPTDRGTERAVEILRLTDWCHPPEFGDQAAICAEFRYADTGPVDTPNAVWLQVLFLPPDNTLSAVTFGHSPNMRIFAATLGRGAYRPPDGTLLRYLLERLRRRNRTADSFDALYGALRDIADLGGDEALSAELDGIRAGVLKKVSVHDLFDYRAAKVTAAFGAHLPRLEAVREDAEVRLSACSTPSPLSVTLVGHSHLDAVWLWPWNVTLGKIHRTFSRNLERLARYPGVTFGQSTPCFYAAMEEHHPGLFKEVRKQVAAGQWELLGGMWVEPDGYMPCGEALIRQRLFGQRYYLEKFGRLSEVAWIPDTFGMHRNHPQVIRKTGGRYFFTTKLSWNYENPFPYQHFIWESPDGSRVLALQSAVGCGAEPGPHAWLAESVRAHNILLKPGERAEVSYRAPFVPGEKRSGKYIKEVLSIFGEGDGGEGPSDRMYRRAHTLAILPGYELGTVHGHFRTVEERYGDRLPVWKDELYLENHRGTFTSQGRIKALNRRGEAALLAAERWAVLSGCLGGDPGSDPGTGSGGYAPPKGDLDRVWKKLLFNQFHDILPGTSIAQAYIDAEVDFDDILGTAGAVEEAALRSLASRIHTLPDKGEPRFATGQTLLLFNPIMWEREETVTVPFGFAWVRVFDTNNREIPSQVIFRDGQNFLVFHVRVPSLGYTQVRLVAGKKPPAWEGVKVEGLKAESPFHNLELDGGGNLRRIHDKVQQRELLKGPANHVRYFKNRPKEWSNWNINPGYERHEITPANDARIEVLDAGPVVAAFRVTKAAPGGGRTVQEIRLYRDDPRIDFITDVEIRYRESFVKAVFPFDVEADFVTTEIACGTHRRPTRPRNSFEKAQWEVWTQKWLDLSDKKGGVTVVNRDRYGFDVKGGQIRLTLVKGGIMPCSHTDVGTHRIAYALVPHAGGFEDAHAWRRGYEYNYPVRGLLEEKHAGDLPREQSFAGLSPEHVCFEALKPAEDGEGMVFRIYEAEGRDSERVTLRLPFEPARAEEVDFLELKALKELPVKGREVIFPMGHDEIKAIRVFEAKP